MNRNCFLKFGRARIAIYTIFIGVIGYTSVNAAVITVHSSRNPLILEVSGKIDIGDELRLSKLLDNSPTWSGVTVNLDSNGGDLETAMRMGRLLRQREAAVSTNNCLSSCVLMFVGGVKRLVFSRGGGKNGVGIHRPYFPNLSTQKSSADITLMRNQMRGKVTNYLSEMNVTVRLLDLMDAIPPESMKFLSDSEVVELGLSAPDPVWDEKNVAKEAEDRAISSQEFRRRRASVDDKCLPGGRAVEFFAYCEEAVLLGISTQSVRSREATYKAWRYEVFGDKHFSNMSQLERQKQDRCWTQIVAIGATSCG